MPQRKDETGLIVGQFEVIKDLGMVKLRKTHNHKYHCVLVKCNKCLNDFKMILGNLFSIKQDDCSEKHISTRFNKSSKAWTRIRHIRNKMIQRCHFEHNDKYYAYGAKGMKVCDLWRNSLEEFYNWAINNGYKDKLTIDRIDNNKGYSPDNCRWTTLTEQSRNKRNVISIDTVKEIRNLLSKGYTHQHISNIVMVNKCRVDDISSGRSWSDIR
jgi:hypothetical protein